MDWLTIEVLAGEPPLDDENTPKAPREPSGDAGEPPSSRPPGLRRGLRSRRRRPDAPGLVDALDAFEGHDARFRELIAAVRRGIRRRPLAALVIGVGIGFIVGGALSFRAGRILLTAGGRHAARELLKRVL